MASVDTAKKRVRHGQDPAPGELTRILPGSNLHLNMRSAIHAVSTAHTPESLAGGLRGEPGLILLQSGSCQAAPARYSFVAARPCQTFRSRGSHCTLEGSGPAVELFGDPWRILENLLLRYELPHDLDVPFPLGGCFGYWGYDLRTFVEPKLPRRCRNDLGLPDCQVGFYPSLVVFDNALGACHIIATGLTADGSRTQDQAQAQLDFWQAALCRPPGDAPHHTGDIATERTHPSRETNTPPDQASNEGDVVHSSMSRAGFVTAVRRAKDYIKAGDIYQVNLSHRLQGPWNGSGWALFERLSAFSPAPFAGFLQGDRFSVVSASPEQFLKFSGRHVQTRPIKGTRPRSADPTRDAQLSYELQTSTKELAELVMITDLLRNDLGKVCEYGSVQTPELARLERYTHVHHLVSTVEGRLRPEISHLSALASCFPGGSITGAPKFRAMEIIDELEPVSRGPYTGALGYIGFNHESQLSIVIRTAVTHNGQAYFHAGAGIVADSDPEAEYQETLAKARGFLECLGADPAQSPEVLPQTSLNITALEGVE